MVLSQHSYPLSEKYMSFSHPQSVGWVEFIHDTLSHPLVTHNSLSATDITPALAIHSPSSSISSTQLLCIGQAENPLESFQSPSSASSVQDLSASVLANTMLSWQPSPVSCPWVIKIRSSQSPLPVSLFHESSRSGHQCQFLCFMSIKIRSSVTLPSLWNQTYLNWPMCWGQYWFVIPTSSVSETPWNCWWGCPETWCRISCRTFTQEQELARTIWKNSYSSSEELAQIIWKTFTDHLENSCSSSKELAQVSEKLTQII